MKMKPIYMLMLVCLIGVSCKHASEQQCIISPGIPPVTSIKLRIVSKTTDSDLFLSPTSPYKPSDLVVTNLTNHNVIPMTIDSTQKNDRFMYLSVFGDGPVVITVKLAALSADTIATNVSIVPDGCFSTLVVNNISLDGKVICTNCSLPQAVTIAK